MTQGVSPSGTGAGSPAPARDAHRLPRCSWAQPWSCKSLGSPWHQARCRVGNGQRRPPCVAHRHVTHTAHQHTAHGAPAHHTPCTGTSHTAHRHITQQHTAHRTPAGHTPCTGTLHTVPTPPASGGAFHLSLRLPRRILIYIKASGKLNCLQSTVCASVLFLLWENTTLPSRRGCAILLSFPCNACSKRRRRPHAPACLLPSG